MSTLVPLVAHIGSPNNPWIGVMTVSAIALTIVFVLVVTDRMQVATPGDLLLPLAGVVLVAGLTGSLGDVINDQGPWAVPIGVVVLVALLVSAFRGGVDFSVTSRPTLVVVVLAVALSVGAYSFLENLWFPVQTEAPLPALEDGEAELTLVSPPDEDGRLVLELTLTNATLGGDTFVRPEDPETELVPRFEVGPVYLEPPVPDDCAAATDCTTARFELTLPAGFVTEPPSQITVELLTADKFPFSPPLTAAVSLDGEDG